MKKFETYQEFSKHYEDTILAIKVCRLSDGSQKFIDVKNAELVNLCHAYPAFASQKFHELAELTANALTAESGKTVKNA